MGSANDTNQSKQARAENQEIGSAGRSTKEQGKATITDVQEGGMVEKRDAMDVSTGNSGGGENTSETQTLEDSNSKMSHGGNKGKSKSYGNKSFQQGDAQGNQNKFKKNQRRKKMDKRERNTGGRSMKTTGAMHGHMNQRKGKKGRSLEESESGITSTDLPNAKGKLLEYFQKAKHPPPRFEYTIRVAIGNKIISDSEWYGNVREGERRLSMQVLNDIESLAEELNIPSPSAVGFTLDDKSSTSTGNTNTTTSNEATEEYQLVSKKANATENTTSSSHHASVIENISNTSKGRTGTRTGMESGIEGGKEQGMGTGTGVGTNILGKRS